MPQLKSYLPAALVGFAIGVLSLFFISEGGQIRNPYNIPVTDNQLASSGISNVPAYPPQGPYSYAEAVDLAAPAVVNIYTSKTITERVHPLLKDPFFKKFFGLENVPRRQRIESSLGSGVVVSQDGYILTNHHVIEAADQIVVALQDGREQQAQVIGTDSETDLAVLYISLPDLPDLKVRNSKQIRVGDVVLAIGNPFGVGQTVTQGIVSATGRNRLGLSTYEDYIQTDAAINPGNSGGALVDGLGNLLGINTAIFSRSGGSNGIGFAVPSELAFYVLNEIIKNGRVVRGWLGIEVEAMNPQLAQKYQLPDVRGILISNLFKSGPANKAGLQPGDIIIEMDKLAELSPHSAMNHIARKKPGNAVAMRIIRQGKEQSIRAIVGERPSRG